MDLFQIFGHFFGPAGSIAVIAGTFYSVSVFIENNLRNQACQDFGSYLESGRLRSTLVELPRGMREVFETIFGTKHLSSRCLTRSIAFSGVAITMIWIAVAVEDPEFRNFTWSLIRPDHQGFESLSLARLTAVLWLAWTLPVDYISLLKTRVIIRWLDARKVTDRLLLLILVLDVLLGSLFFYLGISVIALILASANAFTPNGPSILSGFRYFWTLFDVSDLWSVVSWRAPDRTDSILFYASMVPSIWLWMWVLATLTTRIALQSSSLVKIINYLLPLDSHPVRSVGIVAGVVCSATYLVAHLLASFFVA